MNKTKIFYSFFAILSAISLISLSSCKGKKETAEPEKAQMETSEADKPAMEVTPATPESIARGEALYKKTGCASCHNPTKDQVEGGLGPSFATVASAYKSGGGKQALLEFFGGNNKAIVLPDKYTTMKSNMQKLRKLTTDQRSDLADYVLSF